jgi:hypothetical protein
MRATHLQGLLGASVLLAGCGLYVPEMQPFFEEASREKAFENIIVNNVKCELRNGVYETMEMLRTNTPYPGERLFRIGDSTVQHYDVHGTPYA